MHDDGQKIVLKRHEAEREQRRTTVVANVLAGVSYRKIAEALGVSLFTVAHDMEVILERWKAEQVKAIDAQRQLELARLDVVQNAIWGKVLAGDTLAIDRYMAIVDKRAKLLGLYAPQKIAPTTPDGEESYDPLAAAREFDVLIQRMSHRYESQPDIPAP